MRQNAHSELLAAAVRSPHVEPIHAPRVAPPAARGYRAGGAGRGDRARGICTTFTISWYTSVGVSSDGTRTVDHETLWSNAPHGVLIAIFGGALAVTLAATVFPRTRGAAALIVFVVSALLALTIGWLFLPAVCY